MATLLSDERRARLLAMVSADGAVKLEPAATALGVSVMTVRRDLDDLEAEGLVRRVRGGAVAPIMPRPFAERMASRSTAKMLIARKAMGLVPMSGAVAFDGSSTSGVLLAEIAPHDLIVATNSIDNAATARRRPGVRSILTGGELEERTDSLVGAVACASAATLEYEWFFSSASAVSDRGTSEVSLEEAQLKRVFAQCARQTVLLIDSSKLGATAIARGLDWSHVDVLVTELDPRDERLDPFRAYTSLM